MSRLCLNHGGEDLPAVGRAEEFFAGAVGMGHHAENVSPGVQDARDVAQGAVGIGLRGNFSFGSGVAEGDSVFGFKLMQVLGGAVVVAFHVTDGQLKHFALGEPGGKGAIRGFSAEIDLLADVFETGVAHERTGEQAGLSEDLEAVADAQDQAASGCKALDRLHDGREAGDGAGAQVIAIGKAAGNQDCINALKILGVVPEEGDGLMSDFGNHVVSVVVAVGAGKDQNPEFHGSRVTA